MKNDQLTAAQINTAFDNMNDEERAFARRLMYEGEPGEASTFIEIFYYFPGVRMEAEEKVPEPPPEQMEIEI